MELEKGSFKFMMELDRLAADLRKLGDRSKPQLRKCVIILAEPSADYEIECRILENNATVLKRTQIERRESIHQTSQATA